MEHASPTTITTTEMHTGGEPVRIVESGCPPIPGATILEKRQHAMRELDDFRKLLMHEPRGHLDMYGVIPVEPDLEGAAMAVLFMHNEGFSTMCGHATIALGRYALDRGIVDPVEPVTTFVLQCPCGPVTVHVEVRDGKPGNASFESVDAFAYALDQVVDLDGFGNVTFDVGYGGAFYAFANAAQFGLDIGVATRQQLVEAATALTSAVRESVELHHPAHDDLAFLYGSILTDGGEGEQVSTNVCVFADAQVDRSPTGSGVTARMALRHARGLAEIGDLRLFDSITGAQMTGRVIRTGRLGDRVTVCVEVGGIGYYTGQSTFTVEEEDPLAPGFLVH